MQRLPKEKALLALTVASLVLSAFILLMPTNIIVNVSAVEANGVGVYWDSNCTNVVFSIDWGALEPGSVKNVTVHIRNEGNESAFLTMATSNWNPSIASEYITLEWNYSGQRINPGEIFTVTQTLSIFPNITGISNFSFDILITGQHYIIDLNFDGIVDIFDLVTVARSLGSYPGHLRWNPLADVNDDDIVDIYDVVIVGVNFGKIV